MDTLSEKHNIKNLLFTKAIPNYSIPVPVNGHKVYGCIDCGDKFVFESSYIDHVNRKSVLITYMCRHCGLLQIFYNRCNLLCHIRSHAFKTATINVSDLKVEPLPLSVLKNCPTPNSSIKTKQVTTTNSGKISCVNCPECKKDITVTGLASKDREMHLMQCTNEVHSCPVCLFALPNICGLKSHLRLHLKVPPYYCPECGSHLASKNVQYPYNHDCDGFKMMRATARQNCVIKNCLNFHPNDYKDHMKENHLKKVFKCPVCVVACFNEATMFKHLTGHKFNSELKPLIFYQCEACPGRFIMQNHMDQHLKSHININSFPCWACGTNFKDVSVLLTHYIKDHTVTNVIKTSVSDILKLIEARQCPTNKSKRIYRVVKRCDQCKRSFNYKCKYEEIGILPNECPYKCIPSQKSDSKVITCHLCNTKISQDWQVIKKHYAENHTSYRCLDAEVRLTRINVNNVTKNKNKKQSINNQILNKKISKRSRKRFNKLTPSFITTEKNQIKLLESNDSVCNICTQSFDSKELLERHIVSHRDLCMAYQCMECGQSFVVKPTFSKHLLLEHDISNTEEYIKNKQCYNESALLKFQDSVITSSEPLKENQCKICREQFNDMDELEKHFRVHGMAFLMKNNSNKNLQH